MQEPAKAQQLKSPSPPRSASKPLKSAAAKSKKSIDEASDRKWASPVDKKGAQAAGNGKTGSSTKKPSAQVEVSSPSVDNVPTQVQQAKLTPSKAETSMNQTPSPSKVG